jgi:rod shape determining protein RodA
MDWVLFGVTVFLVLTGLVAIYSATLTYGNASKFVGTQVSAVLIGFVCMILLMAFNYQYYKQITYFLYAGSIFVLMLVLVAGVTIKGTKGWFHLGYFAVQPVEFTKIVFILVLAGYLDKKWKEMKKITSLAVPSLILMGHILLVMIQPDFSSTLVYYPVLLVLLFLSGTETLYLVGIIIYGAIAAGIPLMATYFKMQPLILKASPMLNYIVLASKGGSKMAIVLITVILMVFVTWWFLNQLKFQIPIIYVVALSLIIGAGTVSSLGVQKSLKEYQRKRLIVFLNPDIDPLGSGYNINQSKIAIGSGQFFGKGLFSGTQSKLGFLPEQHTDFIFSVLSEETGFFFSALTVFMYFVLVWRALIISRDARDRYGSLVAAGIATIFTFHGVINMGMVMGLMPATGLPLPILSYGGSCMVSSLCSIGILFSIHVRRFTN